MRKTLWTLLACGVLCGPVWADVVYTDDGRVLRGTVTQQDGKVVVQSTTGRVELNASQVLRIKRERSRTQPVTTGAPSSGVAAAVPVPRPTLAGATDKYQPPIPIKVKKFSLHDACEPEPVLFVLMRDGGAALTGAGMDAGLQIKQWQFRVHERRRKVAGKWFTPKDFVAHRTGYQRLLDEAKEAYRTARKNISRQRSSSYSGSSGSRYSPPRTSLANRDRLPGAVVNKLQNAATSWADPAIRSFLNGVVQYKAGRYTQAGAQFRGSCELHPRVAGFWQGYGLALTKMKQHTLALAAYVEMLRLKPGDREAIRLVREAMGAVSGMIATTPAYAEAERLLAMYETPASSRDRSSSTYRRTTVTWLMPGRSTWRGMADSLPKPTCDRFTFRQAIGVPINKTTLIVDKAAVEGALDVFVQVSATHIAPGRVKRVVSSGSKGPQHLSTVSLEGYSFTPAKADPAKKLVRGHQVGVYALGFYEEMGCRPRFLAGQVDQVGEDGAVKLSVSLASGQGTAPVLTSRGDLVGFLAGKIDPKAAGGGKDVFIGLAKVASILKRRSSGGSYGGYSGVKRSDKPPTPVKGRAFVVYATFGETFN